jgi:NAD(P)-dependent dehydrogenase (short-subunit alcohol dehydrogenase family)
MRLAQKVALITGSAQGIGEAMARRFHKEGAFVIISDVNDSKGLALKEEFSERIDYLHLDVSKESEWQAAYQSIQQQHQRLDILVNNASITGAETTGLHNPERLELESWHQVHAINSDGMALGCKYGIKLLKMSPAASLINLSSRAGLIGVSRMSSYAASKALVRNHSKSVALYCAEKGYPIRVNCLFPGAILTPIWDPMLGEGEDRQKGIDALAQDIPLKRMGLPEEVASAALFLASDDASYISGSELNIDGGLSCQS